MNKHELLLNPTDFIHITILNHLNAWPKKTNSKTFSIHYSFHQRHADRTWEKEIQIKIFLSKFKKIRNSWFYIQYLIFFLSILSLLFLHILKDDVFRLLFLYSCRVDIICFHFCSSPMSSKDIQIIEVFHLFFSFIFSSIFCIFDCLFD